MTTNKQKTSQGSILADARIVFRREFLTRITSGMFLASMGFAVFMIIAGAIAMKVTESPVGNVGIVGSQPAVLEDALPTLADQAGFDSIEVSTFNNRGELESAVLDGDIEVGVVNNEELVVKTEGSNLSALLSLVWQSALMNEFVESSDLDDTQKQELVGLTGELPLTELEPDPESASNFGVGAVLTILMFLTIQIIGGMLLMSVTEEKGNNIVELLLSSMSSRSLLLGKLVANGLLGVIQMVLLIATCIIAINVTDLADIPSIPASLLVVALTWFVVGFAFFGVLIAAGAALAPSQEDAQSVMLPVFVVLMAGYFASFYASGNTDDLVARAISHLPFVSPFVMPSRFLSGDLPLWEHALAFGIAFVCLAVTLRIGARIYTRSVIHTDRKLGWLEAFRSEPVR